LLEVRLCAINLGLTGSIRILIIKPYLKLHPDIQTREGAKRLRREYRAEDACRGPYPRKKMELNLTADQELALAA
jgi:hypothetical protein